MSSIWLPEGVPTWDTRYLVPASWNPNGQTDRVFKNLVDAIREVGFLEPVVVAPIPPDAWQTYISEEQYEEGIGLYRLIVGGKHRWEAGMILEMPRVPIIFKEDFTEDLVKLQNVRLNALKGSMDPEKFQKLYMEMLDKGYEEDLLQVQMGLVEQKALKQLMKDVGNDLPAGMREKFEEMGEDVRTTEDLQSVLDELLSKHGDTLPYNYLLFDFGGKSVAWVRLDKPGLRIVQEITQFSYERHLDVNKAFSFLLSGARERLRDAEDSLLAEADAESVDYA